jgi:hypothetical protein
MNRGPSLIVLIGGPIVLAIGACMAWLAFFPIHETERQVDQTSIHLKQLGIALLMYAADNDDRFPLDTSSARAAWPVLKEYVKNEEHVRGSSNVSPEFLGNATLGGRKLKGVDNEQTIVFFESAPDQGERCVLFGDGRVKRITESEFQKAVANEWRFMPGKP